MAQKRHMATAACANKQFHETFTQCPYRSSLEDKDRHPGPHWATGSNCTTMQRPEAYGTGPPPTRPKTYPTYQLLASRPARLPATGVRLGLHRMFRSQHPHEIPAKLRRKFSENQTSRAREACVYPKATALGSLSGKVLCKEPITPLPAPSSRVHARPASWTFTSVKSCSRQYGDIGEKWRSRRGRCSCCTTGFCAPIWTCMSDPLG